MSKFIYGERKAVWLEFVELYGNLSMASRKVGVGYSSFFKKRPREPAFDQAVKDRPARFDARNGFTAVDTGVIRGASRRLKVGLAADAMRTVLRLPGKGRVVLNRAIADQARLAEATPDETGDASAEALLGLLDQPMWIPLDGPQMQGMTAVPLSSAGTSTAKDRTGQLSFLNKRAEWWWRLREALDPHIGVGFDPATRSRATGRSLRTALAAGAARDQGREQGVDPAAPRALDRQGRRAGLRFRAHRKRQLGLCPPRDRAQAPRANPRQGPARANPDGGPHYPTASRPSP